VAAVGHDTASCGNCCSSGEPGNASAGIGNATARLHVEYADWPQYSFFVHINSACRTSGESECEQPFRAGSQHRQLQRGLASGFESGSFAS
jgi:hypothetical protein